jgi:histidyl-tRNA synthetase
VNGPMFRRERPQKGRYRQFSQVSMEVIGSSSIVQDAYFIQMLDALFSNVIKLENYVIKLNFLGCLDDRKKHKASLVNFLESLKETICETCLARKEKNTLRIFDCKTELCQKLYKTAPRLTEFLCSTCAQEWETLQHLLTALSVSYAIDTTLVRGLDYYNKTVFEFTSRDLGSQNTFCGGGRYSLGREVGATEDYAAIGAAFGIERVVLLAELIQNKITLPQPPALHVIIPLAEEQHTLALLLAAQLQARNLCTDLVLEKASVSNMMKKANKMGAKYVLMIGSEEQQEGVVTVKNMQTGEHVKIKQADVVSFLTNTTTA